MFCLVTVTDPVIEFVDIYNSFCCSSQGAVVFSALNAFDVIWIKLGIIIKISSICKIF